MGWTLNRYFFWRYVTITFWYFVGVYALVTLIDFTEFSSRTVGLPGFTVQLALAVSALRVPMIMQQAVPFVALMSAIATLVSLNRKYELVIARSAGISAWQFLLPFCVGALLFGVLSVAVLNPLAAFGASRSEALENEFRSARSSGSAGSGVPWLRQKTEGTDTIIGAQSVLNQGLELLGVTIFSLNPEGDIVERRDAARAYLRDGYWELHDVTRISEGEKQPRMDVDRVPTNLKPEFVQERLARPETIPFYELPRKIEVAQSFGLKASAFATQFHTLISLPFLLVAMTLIAATVSMRFQRMGQSATMILGGVLAGFLLYVVSVLVKAFGTAGFVPPFVVVWIPVVAAMFFGVTFLLYKEDG